MEAFRDGVEVVCDMQYKALRAAGTTRMAGFQERHDFGDRRVRLRQNDLFAMLGFLHQFGLYS